MKCVFLLATLITCMKLHAQQVGINTTQPQSTLDITGQPTVTNTPDGIIPPRLTRAQLIAKTAYGLNQQGTVVYVTDLSGTLNTATKDVVHTGLYVFNGTKWNPLQKKMMGFSATKNNSYSVTAFVDHQLQFTAEEFDPYNWFNTTNNRFQPNIAGYYYINANASVYSISSALRILMIRKNGVRFKQGSSSYTSPVAISVSVLVYLNGTTDYLDLAIYSTTDYTATATPAETYFQAYYIGD